MKSIFESATTKELENRINSLSPQHSAQWGKMNVFQMVKHCTLCDDMMQGKIKVKRVFLGRLIGPMLLKKALKDTSAFTKNSPTSPLLKTDNESGDIEQQKKEWLGRIAQYAHFPDAKFVHPFFGPMTKAQVGMFVYKHIDHHLRQFGV
jgi:hypothetical protein